MKGRAAELQSMHAMVLRDAERQGLNEEQTDALVQEWALKNGVKVHGMDIPKTPALDITEAARSRSYSSLGGQVRLKDESY